MYDTKKDPLNATVGARIFELREEAGMKQEELAELLGAGVSRSAVAMWEQGERTLKTELLCKLADIFDTSADYLLGRSPNRCIENEDLKAATEFTGLSDAAAGRLKLLNSTRDIDLFGGKETELNTTVKETVDRLLLSDDFPGLIDLLREISTRSEELDYAVSTAGKLLANCFSNIEAEIAGNPDTFDLDDYFGWQGYSLNEGISKSQVLLYEMSEKCSDMVEELYGLKKKIKATEKMQERLMEEYKKAIEYYPMYSRVNPDLI